MINSNSESSANRSQALEEKTEGKKNYKAVKLCTSRSKNHRNVSTNVLTFFEHAFPFIRKSVRLPGEALQEKTKLVI